MTSDDILRDGSVPTLYKGRLIVPPGSHDNHKSPSPVKGTIITMRSVAQVGSLALAASSLYGSAQGLDNITDDTFFYGLSEPVYPSRKWTALLGQVVKGIKLTEIQPMALERATGPSPMPRHVPWLRR